MLSDIDKSFKELAVRRGCPKEPRACPKETARPRGRSPIRRDCTNQEPGEEYNGEKDENGDWWDEDDDEEWEEDEEHRGDETASVYISRDAGHEGGETTVTKVNRREAEKVVIPGFPSLVQLPQWEIAVAEGLVNAGARTDQKEVPWMLKAKEVDSTLESLASSGAERFKSLDLKLATAIKAIVKNNNAVMDLQQTFIAEATTAWRKDRSLLKGR